MLSSASDMISRSVLGSASRVAQPTDLGTAARHAGTALAALFEQLADLRRCCCVGTNLEMTKDGYAAERGHDADTRAIIVSAANVEPNSGASGRDASAQHPSRR